MAALAPSDLADRLEQVHSLESPIASALARRLRGAAWWAPRLARDAQELLPLIDGCDLTAAEVRVHLNFGAVLHVEDLLLRRARLGLWSPTLAVEMLPRLRRLFAEERGWSARQWESEEEGCRQALAGWSPEGIR